MVFGMLRSIMKVTFVNHYNRSVYNDNRYEDVYTIAEATAGQKWQLMERIL